MARSCQRHKASEPGHVNCPAELSSREVLRLLMRTLAYAFFVRTDLRTADTVRERAQPVIETLTREYASSWRVHDWRAKRSLKRTAETERSSVDEIKRRLVETALLEVMYPDPEILTRSRSTEAIIPILSPAAHFGSWLKSRVLARAEQLAVDLSEASPARHSQGLTSEMLDQKAAADPERALERKIAESLLEQIQGVATPAQWRAVEKLDNGEVLSVADRNALYHLRRKLREKGISLANASVL